MQKIRITILKETMIVIKRRKGCCAVRKKNMIIGKKRMMYSYRVRTAKPKRMPLSISFFLESFLLKNDSKKRIRKKIPTVSVMINPPQML